MIVFGLLKSDWLVIQTMATLCIFIPTSSYKVVHGSLLISREPNARTAKVCCTYFCCCASAMVSQLILSPLLEAIARRW